MANEMVSKILKLNGKLSQEWLEKQTSCEQALILELVEAGQPKTDTPEPSPVQLAAEKGSGDIGKPERKDPVTVDVYVANAPPEIREVLAHGLTVHRRQKDELIENLSALDECPWTEQELRGMDIAQLEKLQTLAQSRNDYSAAAGLVDAYRAPASEEALPLPSLRQ